MDVPIPSTIPAGDYLLRAEVIALHASGSPGGAQHYMTCYELSVTGGSGSSTPATVNFPGAYKASDAGILVNIHGAMSSYLAPGPAVAAGGVTRTVGGGQCKGCEATCKVGTSPTGTVVPSSGGGGGGGGGGGAGPVACQVAKYGQCGGTGYTGCTTCQVSRTFLGGVELREMLTCGA
jgi:cellulase